MALIVTTWFWGSKYDLSDVAKLHRGLKRNLTDFKFVVVSDRPAHGIVYDGDAPHEVWPILDEHLTKVKGCFARLRMFDSKWQDLVGVDHGDQITCMDLDSVVTGPMEKKFDRPEDFVILQGANASNPCPFNGSLMMLRAGADLDYVWRDFSVEKAIVAPFFEFPDDQGWLHHKIPNAAGWKCGKESGVYAFQKPGWPAGTDLPSDASLVVFPGWRSPHKFRELAWVKENWK